jgi:hypothetical protein
LDNGFDDPGFGVHPHGQNVRQVGQPGSMCIERLCGDAAGAHLTEDVLEVLGGRIATSNERRLPSMELGI